MRSSVAFLAALAASGVATAFLLPSSFDGFVRETLIFQVGGNLLVGVPVCVVGSMLALLRLPMPGPSTAMWLGASLGVAPLIGGWAALWFPHSVDARDALYAVPLLAIAAPRLPRCGSLVRKSHWMLMAIVILVAAAVVTPSNYGQLPDVPLPLPAAPGHDVAGEKNRPNIVLVSVDTARADHFVGERAAHVPNFEELLSEGAWAKWARSCGNETLPGHSSMLSGWSTLQHGVLTNSHALPHEAPTLAEVLKEGGYRTVGVHTNPVIRSGYGTEQGFEVYDGRLGDVFARIQSLCARASLLGWATGRQQTTLVVGFLDPVGYSSWATSIANLGESTTRLGSAYWRRLVERPEPAFLFLHYMDLHTPYRAPDGWWGNCSPAPGQGRPVESAAARYREEVMYFDACLGKLMEALAETDEPCVILVTSDHGEYLGEHGGRMGHSEGLYEEMIRVPFVLAGDAVPPVELPPPFLVDVAPTLAHLAGVSPANSWSGLDLLNSSAEQLRARAHFMREDKLAAALKGGWKWIAEWAAQEPTSFANERVFHLAERGGEEAAIPLQRAPDDLLNSFREAVAEARLPLDPGSTAGARDADLAALGYAEDDS